MSQTTYTPGLLQPAEWLELTAPGVTIMDRDGWPDKPFEEPITREEFQRRLERCTLRIEPTDLTHQAVFNLNWRAKVKLTEHGRGIVELANSENRQNLHDAGLSTQTYGDLYKVSSSGYLTLQLWQLFHLFGGKNMPSVATYVGIPFETSIVLFPNF